MRQHRYIMLLLLILAVLAGYLLSKASLVGKFGMSFVYTEYAFLKTWWKGALVVLMCWLFLLGVQIILHRRFGRKKSLFVHVGAVVLALIGFYFTYLDFRNTLSHRLLGERFHLGAYLFWIGWIIISIYLLVRRKEHQKIQEL